MCKYWSTGRQRFFNFSINCCNVINATQGNSRYNYHRTERTHIPKHLCNNWIGFLVLTWVLQQQESLPRGRGFLSDKRSWRCEGWLSCRAVELTGRWSRCPHWKVGCPGRPAEVNLDSTAPKLWRWDAIILARQSRLDCCHLPTI